MLLSAQRTIQKSCYYAFLQILIFLMKKFYVNEWPGFSNFFYLHKVEDYLKGNYCLNIDQKLLR